MKNVFQVLLLLVAFVFGAHVVMAQEQSAPASTDSSKPCTAPEFSQFDFWVGEWNLTWGDSGKGTNSVTKDYNDCVIIENFDGGDSSPLRGMSVSTYNNRRGQWQQTWVDNNGSYLDFVGSFVNGKMTLSRQANDSTYMRMVFYNITEHSLDWNWEKSLDGGDRWQTLWQIHYVRKK